MTNQKTKGKKEKIIQASVSELHALSPSTRATHFLKTLRGGKGNVRSSVPSSKLFLNLVLEEMGPFFDFLSLGSNRSDLTAPFFPPFFLDFLVLAMVKICSARVRSAEGVAGHCVGSEASVQGEMSLGFTPKKNPVFLAQF